MKIFISSEVNKSNFIVFAKFDKQLRKIKNEFPGDIKNK